MCLILEFDPRKNVRIPRYHVAKRGLPVSNYEVLIELHNGAFTVIYMVT